MTDNFPLTLRANSLLVSLGAVARLIVSLVSIPVLVRFLGLERYGVWVVLNSVIAVAGLVELGLSTALTNYLAADYARQDWVSANRNVTTSLVLVTCLGVLTSVGLWLTHPLVARALFAADSHQLEALLALGAISWLLLLRLWQQWAMAAEAALLRYDIQAALETGSTIIMQVGIMLLVLMGGSLQVLAAWSLLATACSVIVHGLAVKRLFSGRSLRAEYSRQTANVLLRFGATQWLSNLGSTLFGYADRIIVNLFLGSEAAGLYSAATSIAIQINTLSAIPLRVLPPAISAAKALSQYPRIRQIFIRATRLNGLIVLLTVAPMLFWSRWLSSLLVGTEHAALTSELLRTVVFAYGIYSLSVASYFVAIGVGLPILNARWGVVGALFSLLLLVILTSRAGLVGAAWGNMGYALVLTVNYRMVKIIGLEYFAYLKLFVPSVLIIIVWWLLSEYGITISLSIWAKMLTFGSLGIISAFCVSGLPLVRDFIGLTMELHKKYFSSKDQTS